MTPLHIQLLGDFRLDLGNQPVVAVQTLRLQALVAYLTLHRHAPQQRQHIAFLFWPDTNEVQARTNLRKLLLHLRQAIPTVDNYLLLEGQSIRWRLDAEVTSDVAEFEASLALTATAADQAAVQAALERAVTLYRGELLPACYDDWLRPHREQLQRQALDALRRLVALLEEQRAYRAAIGFGQRLLQIDPVDDQACRTLMRLHALCDDRAGALRVYHVCRTVLDEELGVPPSPATQELYERLIRSQEARIAPPQELPRVFDLIGRVDEWQTLLEAWQLAATGKPGCLVLSGEAGIGKTRLAEELANWVRQQGYTVAHARCYAAVGTLAYAPVVEWLRTDPIHRHLSALDAVWLTEISRLLPDLSTSRTDLQQAEPLREAWQRHLLFEALAYAVLGSSLPTLLFLDDLQWCDSDTLAWLQYLLRHNAKTKLLVVCTVRSEEVIDEQPLMQWLLTLRSRQQVTEMELFPLNPAETATLASHIAGNTITTEDSATLYRETEGNPLFIVEMVRADLSGVIVSPTTKLNGVHAQAGRRSLPPTMQAVIAERLSHLSPPARELAGLAAAIGREFTFAVLAQAIGQDEDALVHSLDELWRRRIVREQGADAYDFTHGKLREVAYGGMSMAARRLAHRRVAQALEKVYVARLDVVAGQVAGHYDKANLVEQAIIYYRRAAKAAEQLFANEEAIRHYRRAIALLEAGAVAPAADVTETYERLGDLLHWTGQYAVAHAVYGQALASQLAEEVVACARLHRKRANSLREQYRYPEALQLYAVALACLETDGPQWLRVAPGPARPRDSSASVSEPDPTWLEEWLQVQLEILSVYYWLGDADSGLALYGRVQPVIEHSGTPLQHASLLRQWAILDIRRNRYIVSDEAYNMGRTGLKLQIDAGAPGGVPSSYFMLGFVCLWHGDLEEAEQHLETALEHARKRGDISLEARAATYLTMVHRKIGNAKRASYFVELSLAAAEAAHMPEYTAMAWANQAWLASLFQDWPAVRELGQAALDLWQRTAATPAATAFSWAARWPMLAAALHTSDEGAVLAHARALLAPQLQPPPQPIGKALEDGLRLADEGNSTEAVDAIHAALILAKQMHYL